MKHKYVEHKDCATDHCNICEGGLVVCEVCGCVEGSLPTDCPGYKCYITHGDRIYKGEIDFIEGKWVEKSISMNSPAKHR